MDPKQANTVQALTESVEEVAFILKKNVEMVQERAGKLEDLDERAEALKEASKQFGKTSVKLKRSNDEENRCCCRKHTTLVAAIVAVVLVSILIIVLLATGVIPVAPPIPTAPPT